MKEPSDRHAEQSANQLLSSYDIESQVAVLDELERVLGFLQQKPRPGLPYPEIVLFALGWSVREIAAAAQVQPAKVLSAIARQRAALWKQIRGEDEL